MQMAYRYGSVLGIDADTAKQLAAATEGYAFAFQALGSIYHVMSMSLHMDEE